MNIDFLYVLETKYPEISDSWVRELEWRHLLNQPVYKIGRSFHPIRRISKIGPFEIVSVVPFSEYDGKHLERIAHEQWSEFRLHKELGRSLSSRGCSEWFFFPTTRERLIFHHWIAYDLRELSRQSLGLDIAQGIEEIVDC